ncbi:sugar ABC transporter substrate-binding protein [Lacticaseibacillus mingshuiensis]|uniref:Sugar ABC transporter substrate-binding protein n=1 Tax=Lacticaseibacillus mingshuiensis TaxID=2799574 RepID=A0ABW4CI70_9LACO|nr:sugar ABC transporter substrate-binding protein [Lacticaseibacillus mingshuiensis]
MKKAFLGAMVAVAALALASCGNKEDAGNSNFSIKDRYTPSAKTPAWKLDKKKKMTTITWYINSDWTTLPFGEDATTAKIKKDLNINIKFVTGDDSKLNALISGGDMPDIVTLMDKTSQAATKANSWAYSLNDLAKKYDPYFLKVANKDTMKWFTLSDNKTYGYPNYSNTKKDYESGTIPVNDNFVIREDVYDALGKPDFTKPGNFEKAMKEIAAKYPKLTPFGFTPVGTTAGGFTDKLQDFLGVPLETDDGAYYDRSLDSEYIQWLKTLNTVYRNKDISDDSFTDDGATFDQKVKTGQYATMFVSGTSGQGGNFTEFMKNSKTRYIAVDGPSSTSGRKATLNQTGISGWLINYITKDAKDPAKVMELFTYLVDRPGQILTKYGIEGVTFKYNSDGKIEYLPEVNKLEQTDNDLYNKKYGISRFLYFNNDRMNALKAPTTSALTQMQKWGVGKLYPHFVIENIKPQAGTAEARVYDQVQTKMNSTVISLIRANSDASFDSTLSNYKDFLKKNNYSNVEKTLTKNMASNRKKLN